VHAPADPEQLEPRPDGLRAVHGLGTTLIAAETTGRLCHGIELNPAYVDVAVERWQRFTGKGAVLDGADQTFNELKESANKHERP
jgi:hypothetical protein